MAKFKIGQTVRCIRRSFKPHNDSNPRYGGDGWAKGLEFQIIDVEGISHGRTIYWGGKDGSGVYESHLELVEAQWDK